MPAADGVAARRPPPAADDAPSAYRATLLRTTASGKLDSFRIRTAPSRQSSGRSLGGRESPGPSPVRETSKLVVDSLRVGGLGGWPGCRAAAAALAAALAARQVARPVAAALAVAVTLALALAWAARGGLLCARPA
jgi:hypothetical protein